MDRRAVAPRRMVRALFVAAGLAGTGVVQLAPGSVSAQAVAAPARLAAARDPRVEWAALETLEARGAALGRIAGESLAGTGVPMPEVRVADIGGASGQFDARVWVLELSSTVLASADRRTASELAAVAGVARHEARHAEQWFAMARLRAADGLDAATLGAEMGIPSSVAAAAAARPMMPGHAAAEARVWWDSIYGAGHDRREGVIAGLLTTKTAYTGAVRRYSLAPSPATAAEVQAARQALAPAYAAYRTLPEEEDAFRAQAQITNPVPKSSARRRDSVLGAGAEGL